MLLCIKIFWQNKQEKKKKEKEKGFKNPYYRVKAKASDWDFFVVVVEKDTSFHKWAQ